MHDDDDLPRRLGELLRYGTVESVDLAAGKIRVRIGEIVTQPLRWATGGSGRIRVWSRPTVGEQVMLLCPEGDPAGGIALRGVHCDAFPAVGDETRDLVELPDGSLLAYDSDAHALEAVLAAGATVRIAASGGVTLDAPVHVTGDLTVDGDVKAGGVSLRHHLHTAVQSGGGLSGEPKT